MSLKTDLPPGPMKSLARTSAARIRPASWAASASRHIWARTRPLTVVGRSGRSGVIGPSTGPYPYRLLIVTSTAPVRSAAASSAAASGGQSRGQRWYGGLAQL